MKLKNHVLSGEVTYYTCMLCIAVMALYIHWLPPFMIALVVFRFIERYGQRERSDVNRASVFLLYMFLLLFAWQVAGLFQTDSMSAGIERIYKRASLVLFPLALFIPSMRIQKNILNLLKVFSICLFVYFIFCLGHAVEQSISFVGGKIRFIPYDEVYTYESYFTGLRLAAGAHPSYIALYSLLSLIISIESIFESEKFRNKAFWALISLSNIVFIVLLSSRSGIIATVMVLPFLISKRLKKYIPLGLLAGSLIFVLAGFTLLALNNERIKYSIRNFAGNDLEKVLEEDIRMTIWKSAWSVIREHPVAGVGTGNASLQLKQEFINKGYSKGLYQDLNAHNQFLEILLENGMIGLIMFIVLLGCVGYIALTRHNHVLQAFIVMIIIFFLFESMLNRLAGVMFFPFFTFLLIHYKSEKV